MNKDLTLAVVKAGGRDAQECHSAMCLVQQGRGKKQNKINKPTTTSLELLMDNFQMRMVMKIKNLNSSKR